MSTNIKHPQPTSGSAHWFIIASSMALFFYALNSPTQNWDILGYSASVISMENTDADFIHNYVYEEFKAYATDDEFRKLTEADGKGTGVMFLDANAFNQQIPYYKIRILFVLLIFVLVKMGINIYLACHIVAAATTCIGMIVFYHAYKKIIHPLFWLAAPLLFVSFGAIDVAQMVTADSLAFLWVGLISYAYIHNYWKIFFILLITSVMVRTDMIVLVALFTVYFISFRPDLRYLSAISFLISMGVYFSINELTGNYGWSTLFYFVFISGMEATHPSEYSTIGVTAGQYFSAIIGNLNGFFYNRPFLLFELAVFLQFTIFWLSQKKDISTQDTLILISTNPVLVLTLLSVAYFMLHYIFFPVVWSRFFVGQYMISALGLLSIITELLTKTSKPESSITI